MKAVGKNAETAQSVYKSVQVSYLLDVSSFTQVTESSELAR